MRTVIEMNFVRQASNLLQYMNSYSMTLRNQVITEQEFSRLYKALSEYLATLA